MGKTNHGSAKARQLTRFADSVSVGGMVSVWWSKEARSVPLQAPGGQAATRRTPCGGHCSEPDEVADSLRFGCRPVTSSTADAWGAIGGLDLSSSLVMQIEKSLPLVLRHHGRVRGEILGAGVCCERGFGVGHAGAYCRLWAAPGLRRGKRLGDTYRVCTGRARHPGVA